MCDNNARCHFSLSRISASARITLGETLGATQVDAQLAAKIRHARLQLGLSLEEIARLVEVEPSQYEAIEAGNTYVQALTLSHLALIFDKPISWFFEQERPEPDKVFGDMRRWRRH